MPLSHRAKPAPLTSPFLRALCHAIILPRRLDPNYSVNTTTALLVHALGDPIINVDQRAQNRKNMSEALV